MSCCSVNSFDFALEKLEKNPRAKSSELMEQQNMFYYMIAAQGQIVR